MTILASLIVWIVCFGLVWWIVTLLPIPAAAAQVVRVCFLLMLVLAVLSVTGIFGPALSLPHVHLG